MTQSKKVTELKVGDVTFRFTECPDGGVTYALIPHGAFHAKDRKPLFTSHVEVGMGKQTRKLARVFDKFEAPLETVKNSPVNAEKGVSL